MDPFRLKLQVCRDENWNEDQRGENWEGSESGDHHRTVTQIDDIPGEMADEVLAEVQTANKLFKRLSDASPGYADPVASALGLGGEGIPRLMFRLYDADK